VYVWLDVVKFLISINKAQQAKYSSKDFEKIDVFEKGFLQSPVCVILCREISNFFDKYLHAKSSFQKISKNRRFLEKIAKKNLYEGFIGLRKILNPDPFPKCFLKRNDELFKKKDSQKDMYEWFYFEEISNFL